MKTLREYIDMVTENQVTDAWFNDGFKTSKISDKIEKYEIAQEPGEIVTKESNGKPVPYGRGDYIMTGPEGEQYVISPAKFKELKDDLGNGQCRPKSIPKIAKLADHDGFVTVDWGKGPQQLHYTAGNDYIVKHGPGDYGVVKKDIFAKTYNLPIQNKETK